VSSPLIVSLADQVHPGMTMMYPFDSQPLLSRVAAWLLDTVASLFALPVPEKVNEEVPVVTFLCLFSLTLQTRHRIHSN
jgi:hypothetical protein